VIHLYAIALCIDEAYLLPGLVTLTSVANSLTSKARSELAIRVLAQDLTRSHVDVLANYCKLLGFGSFDLKWCWPASGSIIVEGDYISTTTYLRFQLTPEFVGRPYLIYLDADVLVFDDISAPLGSLNGRQLGAVRDEFNFTVGECLALPGLVAERPHLHGSPYYNADAVWMYSSLMPEIATGVGVALTNERRFIHHNDQDVLNLWLLANNEAIPLPGRFNRFELDRFLEESDWVRLVVKRDLVSCDTSMLHFVGPTKPWHDSCPPTKGVRLYRSQMREVERILRRLGVLSINVEGAGKRGSV